MTANVPKIQLVDHRGQPMAAYEAAKPSPYRKHRTDHRGANPRVREASTNLRAAARHLAENSDLARHAFNVLVNNIVGASGISIEPQPRTRDGDIDTELGQQIRSAWLDWAKRPEVTRRYNWAASQRLMCRSWLRDGDAFAQYLEGATPGLDHGTRVPFSLELLEADFFPLGFNDPQKNIVQGIQRNAWGRRTHFHVHKQHPGDIRNFRDYNSLKVVTADKIVQIGLFDRMHQERGVTICASVIQRIEDITDIDEAERIAVKMASSLGGYIRKGSAEQYVPGEEPTDSNGDPIRRELIFQPGMVFDDLAAGEEVGMFDTNRPNNNLDAYLQGHYRAAAGGFGISHSSFAHRYDGTYSAQRQELVEQWINYAVMQAEFSGQFAQPTYERFARMALLSGQIRPSRDIDMTTIDDAMYVGPQMPWIDPYKEEIAAVLAEEHLHATAQEIIRRRGANPAEVLEQQAAWEKLKEDNKLQTKTDKEFDEKQFGENEE